MVGIKLLTGSGQATDLRYDVARGSLFFNRFRAGEDSFSNGFALAYEAEVTLEKGRLKLQLFVDHSSVEVFANDGVAVLTGRVFPDAESDGLELYAIGGEAQLHSLTVWPLASIWDATG